MPAVTSRVAATVVGLALCAGCAATGAEGDPRPLTTPTPSRTATATPGPTRSGTPTPTPTSADVAAAEKTYRTLTENVYQLEKQGGLQPGEKVPTIITDYAEGAALKGYDELLHKIWDLGSTWKSGRYRIVSVRAVPSQSTRPGEITLVSCEDWRSIRTTWDDGHEGHGRLIKATTTYRVAKSGSATQRTFLWKQVKSCPA
ncbi:hypothetical protein [Acidipropionibacterium timonense]|uniref:hypothetical protein n=1 Tax=Acidipropionibacterium timonense TaxID=2161818 RepID=UPI001436C5F4|nr:hypothetical protein [Acidipropionibacterium timonense]